MNRTGSSATDPPERRSSGSGAAEPLTPLREQQLLAAHRAGDPDALATLLRGYQGRIYAVCYRMLHSHEESTDLAQDAMVKILEGLHSYDGRSQLSTWIIRVTMNCCLSHLRRQKLRKHASLDDRAGSLPDVLREEPLGPRRVEQDERREALVEGLASIDPEARAIITLRDVHDLDYQQIGEILEVPVGTVKSRLFRARSALRTAMERGQDPAEGSSQDRGGRGASASPRKASSG